MPFMVRRGGGGGGGEGGGNIGSYTLLLVYVDALYSHACTQINVAIHVLPLSSPKALGTGLTVIQAH